MNPDVIVLCSGGLDSVVLAHHLARYKEVLLLSFKYGQRHAKEIGYAAKCADYLRAEHIVLDIGGITQILQGNALTDPMVAVPEGHYEDESMKINIVPNRNAILLSCAFAVAIAHGATQVATAFHAGDNKIFPDCRPAFTKAFNTMEWAAMDNSNISLITPFIEWPKQYIVALGNTLRVPFSDTWTCYIGGNLHCGRCGACVERKEAFITAAIYDPTVYED